jgi:hypothetical protein
MKGGDGMTPIRLFGRRWTTALLLAVGAIAIGAVFGSFRTGSAATTVAPTNQSPPTISGTAQEGSTLTAGNGTWSGTTPITFIYQWQRCDMNGKSCSPIAGQTNNTYTVQHADVGNTLLINVVGTNSDGKDSESSVATAVVTAAPAPTGCPSGTGVIQIADLTSPAHLLIGTGSVTPSPVTRTSGTIQVHFIITACGGRPVQGALVYVTATPYNQFSIPPEATTGADGSAVLSMNELRGFPASGQQQLLVVFVRARKSGEDLLGGISARRLVSFPVNLKA